MDNTTFVNFITKGLTVEKSETGTRDFIGHITAEIVDKQDEFIAINEVLKAFPEFMRLHRTLSDSHSSRGVGTVKEYALSEIEGHPSVMIKGTIHRSETVELYDHIWEEIKSGVRKGLSIGGASKSKEPMIKNGKIIMKLADLEIYEIDVCVNPANKLAIIKDVNIFAKAVGRDDIIKHACDIRDIIQCDTIRCEFSKVHDLSGGKKQKVSGEEMDKTMSLIRKPIRGKTWDEWGEILAGKYPDKATRDRVIAAMEVAEKENISKLQNTSFRYGTESQLKKTVGKGMYRICFHKNRI